MATVLVARMDVFSIAVIRAGPAGPSASLWVGALRLQRRVTRSRRW